MDTNTSVVEPVTDDDQKQTELFLRLKRTAVQLLISIAVMLGLMVLGSLMANGVDSVTDVDWAQLGDNAIYSAVILVVTGIVNFLRPLQTNSVPIGDAKTFVADLEALAPPAA